MENIKLNNNKKCCLCGKPLSNSPSDHNNAEPIVEGGICCEVCNDKVISARLKQLGL